MSLFVHSVPKPVVAKAAKFEDTAVKTIPCELSDDQGFLEDSRQFVDVPMDAAVTYRWKFMNVNTSEATDDEPGSIRLAFSKNSHDLPTPLPTGCWLLYDGVIHCLPHNQTFSEPIRLSFRLPASVDLSHVRVMYSNTDIGDETHWMVMDGPEYSAMGASWYPNSESHRNKAVLLANCRELQLVLEHFCIFAILVDGQEERAQNVVVETFLKTAVSSFRYTINVLVVVGCNTDNCVSVPLYSVYRNLTKCAKSFSISLS